MCAASYVKSDGTRYGFEQTPIGADGTPIGLQAQSTWLRVVPWGIYKLLKHLDAEYGSPEVMVTENGCSAPGEAGMSTEQAVQDTFRCGGGSRAVWPRRRARGGAWAAPKRASTMRRVVRRLESLRDPPLITCPSPLIRNCFEIHTRLDFYAGYLDQLCRAVQDGEPGRRRRTTNVCAACARASSPASARACLCACRALVCVKAWRLLCGSWA